MYLVRHMRGTASELGLSAAVSAGRDGFPLSAFNDNPTTFN